MIRQQRRLILLADDDPDDRLLAQEALRENDLEAEMRCVEDGEELLDYLHRRNGYADPAESPRPDLILLDLNMPRMDGGTALRAIKQDPALRAIPVVVLSTANTLAEVDELYAAGANSFITKPQSFDSLVEIVGSLGSYWFGTTQLPG